LIHCIYLQQAAKDAEAYGLLRETMFAAYLASGGKKNMGLGSNGMEELAALDAHFPEAAKEYHKANRGIDHAAGGRQVGGKFNCTLL